jgi:hypothetical protein
MRDREVLIRRGIVLSFRASWGDVVFTEEANGEGAPAPDLAEKPIKPV